jgi:threonyl-tRNA synthetase
MRVALLIALILAAAAWPLWLHAAQALVKPISNHLSNRSQSVHADRIYEPAHEIISNPHEGVSP